jgi:YHS domain-containing protein
MKKSLLLIAAASFAVTACTGGDANSEDTEIASEIVAADANAAPDGPIYTKNAGETLALSGYDAVSYFVGDGIPVEGAAENTVLYQGYEYRFANAENAATFSAEPAKYAPAYGGYCAWAIGANDALAPGNPNVYEIVDGKLYLNFNEQVQGKWQENKDGFISQADTNYPNHDASEHYTS